MPGILDFCENRFNFTHSDSKINESEDENSAYGLSLHNSGFKLKKNILNIDNQQLKRKIVTKMNCFIFFIVGE